MVEGEGWQNHRVRGKKGNPCRVSGRCGWRGGGVRERRLIKHDMARDEDTARGKVKASVTLVIRRISEKDTEGRPGSQLMVSGGGGVRVTRTPEDAKVVVPRRGTE
jgi:hypothetical protein